MKNEKWKYIAKKNNYIYVINRKDCAITHIHLINSQ